MSKSRTVVSFLKASIGSPPQREAVSAFACLLLGSSGPSLAGDREFCDLHQIAHLLHFILKCLCGLEDDCCQGRRSARRLERELSLVIGVFDAAIGKASAHPFRRCPDIEAVPAGTVQYWSNNHV